MKNLGRQLLGILVGFLAITGVGSSVFYFLREPNNPGFLDYPVLTGLHVVLGALYLTLAPFQFVRRIRSRWLSFHRWSGRLLVTIGAVTGLTALFLAIVIPYSGVWETIINGFFALFFLTALGKGILHVRNRRIDLHREWMIRAFAIALGIATMRLIFIPALIFVGRPTHDQAATLSIVSFTVAFSLHAILAEIWIRRTRTLRVLSVQESGSDR